MSLKCGVCNSNVRMLDGDFVCESCNRRTYDCQCLTPGSSPAPANDNIRVEITDPREFHCFKLVLNPEYEECQNCRGRGFTTEPSLVHEQPPDEYHCEVCRGEGKLRRIGSGIEIMLHAHQLVDLIHKSSAALCDWQTQTSAYLIDRLKNLKRIEGS